MNELNVFIDRMNRIGIQVELGANYPWIYLEKINGKRVIEKQHSEHGWTIALLSIKKEDRIKFVNLKETLKLIKNYANHDCR